MALDPLNVRNRVQDITDGQYSALIRDEGRAKEFKQQASVNWGKS